MKKRLALLLIVALLLSCLSCTALAANMIMEIQCTNCYMSWECTIVDCIYEEGEEGHTTYLQCTKCNYQFSIHEDHHYEGDDSNTGYCRLCGYRCPHPADSVAEANCISPKRCGLCNMVLEYGVDLTNHAGDDTGYEPYNAYEHHFVWTCCKDEIYGPEPHRWGDGQCCDCRYWCAHPEWSDGVCVICGEDCPHESYTAGVCDACGSFCTSVDESATCLAEAYCEACKINHRNPVNHAGGLVWNLTATTHEQKWSCCGLLAVESAGHDWSDGVCTVCSYACKHAWSSGICEICNYACAHREVTDEAVEPTCTETGLTAGKHCSVCNAILVAQTEVPATGHREVTDEAVEPSCTETGLTAGKHCSVCNAILVAQTEVPATGHREVTDEAVEPTCTETGLTAGKHCSVCNAILVAQTKVPATGHTEVTDEAVEPSCTETGLTAGKHCSVCTAILVAQTEVPATGHREVTDEAVEPTCTETGLTAGKHCSVCNAILVAQTEVPEKGHIEVTDPAIPATHVTTGLSEGSHCSVCGEILVGQQLIPTVEVPTLTLPAALDAIEAEAFAGNAFACVVIPEGCTEIGAAAFRDCMLLRFVEIPASVATISATAFEGCGEDLIIVTVAGSEAERFAETQGIACILR